MTIALALALSLSTSAAASTSCSQPIIIGDVIGSLQETTTGATIPLGGVGFIGIEPDEIDFTSECAPIIELGPVFLTGIEPDEIDNALADQGSLEILFLGETEPQPATREHVLLSRQVEVPLTGHLVLGRQADPAGRSGSVEVTTTGTLVVVPTSGWIHEEVDRTGATTRTLELSFAVTEVIPDEEVEVLTVYLQEDASFGADAAIDLELLSPETGGTALMPEQPICANCKADIAK